jgi:H+-translocating NAD(P) transhydrogenase subunit alpha
MTGLLVSIYLFVLATFVGWQIITKIPPMLHTPLMSGANAVSGITIVGALVACHGGALTLSNVLGSLAVVFAMINVVGGFAVTDRMLRMFKRKERS